jgi:O-antigen chain-terminating methyltransferase
LIPTRYPSIDVNRGFYRLFEDRFRGPRELIKSRLDAYLPFIEPLARRFVAYSAIDLGCGRGEWLELLKNCGLKAKGVDLDQDMLQACHERGLSAELSEALEYLNTLEDESQLIVSAFHLVEHMKFEELQILISQSFRILKPGGLMILETPNPENIAVATRNFYFDPTHTRPIPQELLSFLAEYAGFSRIKVLRLHESIDLPHKKNISMQAVFSDVSPDYSVVAQKKAGPEELELLSSAFDTEYGVSLDQMLSRWDQRFNGIETSLAQTITEQRSINNELRSVNNELRSVYASKSWRITAPLRKIYSLFKNNKT